MATVDPRYIAARRALLDALFALQGHAEALVIAGAQAVYLHTGDGDLAIAPFTTDADLAVHPDRLSADPLIEPAMTQAGFKLNSSTAATSNPASGSPRSPWATSP